MDTEPFQDTPPPRHAIESDESEDEGNPTSVKTNVPRPKSQVELEWLGAQPQRRPLLVSLDEAGRQWTRGVEHGEIKGRVFVDNVEVASLFLPDWADVTVVSTILRLPMYAIHPFASTVINTLRPTNVVIVDAYAVPLYISSSPPSLRSPIRYLCTSAAPLNPPLPEIKPFLPPNLIQSPAASFLSILESSAHAAPATLLLLPSSHIPPPAPPMTGSRSGPELHDEWEPSNLVDLHRALTTVIGIKHPWSTKHVSGRSADIKVSRRGDIGEGSMYI